MTRYTRPIPSSIQTSFQPPFKLTVSKEGEVCSDLHPPMLSHSYKSSPEYCTFISSLNPWYMNDMYFIHCINFGICCNKTTYIYILTQNDLYALPSSLYYLYICYHDFFSRLLYYFKSIPEHSNRLLEETT